MWERLRWRLVFVVFVNAVGWAMAQSIPVLATTPAGATIYQELVSVFDAELRTMGGSGPAFEQARDVRTTMYAGAAALGLEPVEPAEAGTVCAYLVGGGGNPRLDGGGTLLAQRSPRAFPGAAVATMGYPPAPSANAWPLDERRIVILDQFDLTALATSLQGLIETEGSVAIDPSDRRREGLWSALYGYRLRLAGRAGDPETVEVPHGHLVAFHALANLGPEARITDVVLVSHPRHAFEQAVLTVRRDGAPESALEVRLVAVDFADLPGIGRALQAHGGSQREDTVVTSWGFVDCALADRYDAYVAAGSPTARTIAEFWEETIEASGNAARLLTQLCAAFEAPIRRALGTDVDCRDPEALAGLATVVLMADVAARSAFEVRWDPIGATRYFASAGNQGLAIPMPPAAWPGVYGVEACTALEYPRPARDRAWFSNVGGIGGQPFVRALGAWFEPPVARRGSAGATRAVGYWGTSYAAPTAAVIAASLSAFGAPFYFEPCANP